MKDIKENIPKTKTEEELKNEKNEKVIKRNIKYEKLIEEFGTQIITEELIERFEKVTKKPIYP